VSNGPAPAAKGPAATVRAYFTAINDKDYAAAWRLGGVNTNTSYASFAGGFHQTARDKVTILSVTGNVVTARLAARQKNGAVLVFQGTYIVEGGVITQFDVQQIS
jgi:hypothetical protein